MTEELEFVNSPLDLLLLQRREAMVLLDWILERLAPSPDGSTENSYFLKHVFEKETGLYVSNGQFKGAMLLLGGKPQDEGEVNWSFSVFVLPLGL